MTFRIFAIAALAAAGFSAQAQQPVKLTMQTNWRAQGEHGGYYQALATGLYAKQGLDVTLKAGGPQINLPQLLAANAIDFSMGSDSFGGLNYVKNNVPLVVVASIFQKDPRILMAHPGQGNDSLAALKGKPILIAYASRNNYWQFLRAKYGYTDDQIRPYTFNMAPFLADKSAIQQGFLTSEPLKAIKAGIKPVVHLLADNGYVSYATTLETRSQLVKERPDVVQRFVNATLEGWYGYLYGDRKAANALIQKDNPEMDDEQLAYSHAKMLEYGIVDSGDALKLGIGAMSDARWKEFTDTMVKAGVYPADVDVTKAYTLQFVNKGHGMNLKRN
ncbi:MAG: ABC transporter substrate-binding protein [Betaproteobacteria bacterium]|nr:MAG: ABC transporter substrate-binding protein [Betaproteobacteria bacterium]